MLESVADYFFLKMDHFPANQSRVRVSSLFLFLVIEK